MMVVILCRIRSILTIPISKYIIGRQRNFSCYLSIIGHCLFVIVAITKKISIHSMFVSTGRPPGIPHLIIINESIRTSSRRRFSKPSSPRSGWLSSPTVMRAGLISAAPTILLWQTSSPTCREAMCLRVR